MKIELTRPVLIESEESKLSGVFLEAANELFQSKVVKQPIMYSEEEVKALFENWLNTNIQEELMRISGEIGVMDGITFDEWFNENKKK